MQAIRAVVTAREDVLDRLAQYGTVDALGCFRREVSRRGTVRMNLAQHELKPWREKCGAFPNSRRVYRENGERAAPKAVARRTPPLKRGFANPRPLNGP